MPGVTLFRQLVHHDTGTTFPINSHHPAGYRRTTGPRLLHHAPGQDAGLAEIAGLYGKLYEIP